MLPATTRLRKRNSPDPGWPLREDKLTKQSAPANAGTHCRGYGDT